jgi:hypothetical protein
MSAVADVATSHKYLPESGTIGEIERIAGSPWQKFLEATTLEHDRKYFTGAKEVYTRLMYVDLSAEKE